MMSLADLLILLLATYRLASLIANEDGPANLLASFRALVGVRYDEDDEGYGTNNFATGLICIWCNSPWIGALLVVAYYAAPQITVLVALPFALSVAAMALERHIG